MSRTIKLSSILLSYRATCSSSIQTKCVHDCVCNDQTKHFWTLAPILKHNVSIPSINPRNLSAELHYTCNYFPHWSFISIQMQCTMKHIQHPNIITLLLHTHQNSLWNLQNISPNIAYMNPLYLTFQQITMMMVTVMVPMKMMMKAIAFTMMTMMIMTMTKTLSLTATGPHNQSHNM